ncbi:MAG: hypothetical protein ABF747_02430 [Bifidobacterium sp.]|uniref:DNA-binding protein n=1 Tax=Bifidobacterium fermentum TaxID=3059035 RepID=A0AB39UE11_9BIFI
MKSIEELKSVEYWTAMDASRVLNIDYKCVRDAFNNNSVVVIYPGSSRAKASAEELRSWARNAPLKPGGEWRE